MKNSLIQGVFSLALYKSRRKWKVYIGLSLVKELVLEVFVHEDVASGSTVSPNMYM